MPAMVPADTEQVQRMLLGGSDLQQHQAQPLHQGCVLLCERLRGQLLVLFDIKPGVETNAEALHNLQHRFRQLQTMSISFSSCSKC
jgi:hypothetical protein